MLQWLTWREIRYGLSEVSLVFLLLLIGFIGPLTAASIRESVGIYLREQSRQILASDVSVTALRPFSDEEIKEIKAIALPLNVAKEIEFVTMARGKGTASLIEVSAVDDRFPIYGRFKVDQEVDQYTKTTAKTTGEVADRTRPKSQATVYGSAALLESTPSAWVYPEVLAQLDLKIGESMQIGKSEFKILGTVKQGPGLTPLSMITAPRVYLGRAFVEKTGLVQYGSQIHHKIHLRLPQGSSSDVVATRIKDSLPDPDIYLRTPSDASQSFEKFFSFFNLYLVIITMIVFSLSWLSAFYILQVYVTDRLRNAGILLTLGASRSFVCGLYALQLLLVTMSAFLSALLGCRVVFAAVNLVLVSRAGGSLLPVGFSLISPANVIAVFAGVAGLSAVGFSLPLLRRIYSVPLQTLLQEDSLKAENNRVRSGSQNSARYDRLLNALQPAIAYGPLGISFLLLSAWLTNSVQIAMELAGGLVLSALFALQLSRICFRIAFARVRARQGSLRLIITNLARARFGNSLCFLALVLVVMTLNLIPHLLLSVRNELQPLEAHQFPALFLFNVPERQIPPITDFLTSEKAQLRFLSPLIQARLLKVNDSLPEADYLQRYPVRISYRERPIASEKIIAGEELGSAASLSPQSKAGDQAPVPGISVEIKFAERNHFRLGDHLKFDVQGIEVEGKIVNFRKVRWTDFNPNFFMLFQLGVLEEAPKTWLANVMIPDGDGDGTKIHLQFELLKRFPDISVIDIGRTIARGLEIAASVVLPVRLASWFAVLMTFCILIGVVSHNLRLRKEEIEIQKLIGADGSLIRMLIAGEYLLSSALAFVLGAGLALALSFLVTSRLLEIPLAISTEALLGSFILSVSVPTVLAFVVAGRLLGRSSAHEPTRL